MGGFTALVSQMYLQMFAVGSSLAPVIRSLLGPRGVFVDLGITVSTNNDRLIFGAGTRLQVFPSKCWKPSSDFEKMFSVNSQLALIRPHGTAGHWTGRLVGPSMPLPAWAPSLGTLCLKVELSVNQISLVYM